jgi:cold shock CspA family protein
MATTSTGTGGDTDTATNNLEAKFDAVSNDTNTHENSAAEPMFIEGIVLRWHATKGIGEVEDDQTGERYFAHWHDLCPRVPPVRRFWKPTLQTGESVRFQPGTNDTQGPNFGKRIARNITGPFGRPILSDWITIPRCKYRGDPRDGYDYSDRPRLDDHDCDEFIDGIVVEWNIKNGEGVVEDDRSGALYDLAWRDITSFRKPPREGWTTVLQVGESVRFRPCSDDRGQWAEDVTGPFCRPIIADWITIETARKRGDPRGEYQ